MKNRFFTLLAAAALILAGCSKDKDDNVTIPEGESNFYLQIDLGPASKADTNEVPQNTVTQFTKGAIFFVDGNGDIVRMAVIDDSPAGAVSAANLAAGYLFTGIDNSAVKVYVVGNHDFGSATYANISDVEKITKHILSQTNQDNKTTFGVEDATLFGVGNIVAASAATQALFASNTNISVEREAIFTISPIIARLEIDEIKAAPAVGDPLLDIEELNLAGIYINNYYYSMSVVGTMDLDSLFFAGTQPTAVPADYDKYLQWSSTGQPTGKYRPNLSKYLYDDGELDGSGVYQGLCTSIAPTVLSKTPENETWAYNVFANGTAVPHIILHFTDVKMNSVPRPNAIAGDGEAYLTVTGYLNRVNQADQPIMGGNVYKLDAIQFDGGDLDDYPYEKDDKSAIYVKVTVKPWNVVVVDWK